jgi:hypothetical protein
MWQVVSAIGLPNYSLEERAGFRLEVPELFNPVLMLYDDADDAHHG